MRSLILVIVVVGLAFPAARHAPAQVARGVLDTTVVAADPGDALGAARAAQVSFERARERHLPVKLGSRSGAFMTVLLLDPAKE